MPSIQYKLVSTHLSYQDCDKAMTRIKPVLLNIHSLLRNCNRNIIFLPEENLGLGYRHWYLMKGFEKLKLAFLHFRRKDTTGSLLKICLSYTQLEIGNASSFLHRNPKQWKKYVTPTWLTDLWEFCYEASLDKR